MIDSAPLVELSKILTQVKRVEPVEAQVTYSILGAHWYGKGLYTKDVKTGVEIKAKNLFKVLEGDFVYNRLFAWKGSFSLANQNNDSCYVSNEFPCFEVNESRVYPRFLEYYFSRSQAWHEALGMSSGGTPTSRNRLKEDKFLSMAISLPPLEEQRRIVGRIEALVEKVEEARELRAIALQEAEVALGSALREAFKGKETQAGWTLRPLGDAAEIARGKFAHRPRNDPRFYGGDIPFIQIGDISGSNLYIKSYSQTLNEEGLAISRLFKEGTIVIAITGATIGVTGILTFDSSFPDSIVGITARDETAFPKYLYWSLEYVKNKALSEATQTTQPNINLKHLNSLSIPLPPIPEQHRIVTYLDNLQTKIDQLKQLQTETETELNALIPAILDKAFKGEL